MCVRQYFKNVYLNNIVINSHVIFIFFHYLYLRLKIYLLLKIIYLYKLKISKLNKLVLKLRIIRNSFIIIY